MYLYLHIRESAVAILNITLYNMSLTVTLYTSHHISLHQGLQSYFSSKIIVSMLGSVSLDKPGKQYNVQTKGQKL